MHIREPEAGDLRYLSLAWHGAAKVGGRGRASAVNRSSLATRSDDFHGQLRNPKIHLRIATTCGTACPLPPRLSVKGGPRQTSLLTRTFSYGFMSWRCGNQTPFFRFGSLQLNLCLALEPGVLTHALSPTADTFLETHDPMRRAGPCCGNIRVYVGEYTFHVPDLNTGQIGAGVGDDVGPSTPIELLSRDRVLGRSRTLFSCGGSR